MSMSDGISAGSAQRDWLEVDRDRPDGISAGAAQRDCCWIVFEREGRGFGLQVLLGVVVGEVGGSVTVGVGSFGEYTNAGAAAENTDVFGLGLCISFFRT